MSEISRRNLIGTGAALAVAGSTLEAATTAAAQTAATVSSTARTQLQDAFLGARTTDSWAAIKPLSSQFDVVIIGAGTFGGYLADKIYRQFPRRIPGSQRLKVLLVEWGSFLLNTHYQNVGGQVTKTILAYPPGSKGDDLSTVREGLWNTPWISDVPFRGLATCVGGRSLLWAGWSPQLDDADLARWPKEIRQFLKSDPDGYAWVAPEIGVSDSKDYLSKTSAIYGAASAALKTSLHKVLDPSSKYQILKAVDDAPLAVSAAPRQSGLFPFDKFSSAAFLSNAICEDRWNAYWDGNAGGQALSENSDRSLFLLTNARVQKLVRSADGTAVERIELEIAGQGTQTLDLGPQAVVVLANSTIESTRIAINDLGISATGKATNLMAHLRSNLLAKISRKAFRKFYPNLPTSPVPGQTEIAAFLVRGEDKELNRRFHFQVAVASLPNKQTDPSYNLWKMVPDTETINQMLANRTDDVWVSFNLVGEMSCAADGGTSFIEKGPIGGGDPVPKARVSLVPNDVDRKLWKAMELAALRLAWHMGNGSEKDVTLLRTDGVTVLPRLSDIEKDFDGTIGTKLRDPIGASHHEAGPLQMGSDPSTTVTDLNGKFHHLRNVYVVGPALFPTSGSANPTLTGLALTRRLAIHLNQTIGQAKFKQQQLAMDAIQLPTDEKKKLLNLPLTEFSTQSLGLTAFAVSEQTFASLSEEARAAELNNP
ncbi:GMC family oxidoreductase [Bradyrhizobium daqingense]|uniref:GMC family oxidoreductase n=1 Tax=Bradyrhizobium daqingense TaxID=993502 RepID=UPI00383851CA